MSTSNPYRVNVQVTQVAVQDTSSGKQVTAATFTYLEAATGKPLGSSQLGGNCVQINFKATPPAPAYDSIAYQLDTGASAAGVTLTGATTNGPSGSFPTAAVNNSVTIPDPVGVQEGTVLAFSINGLAFVSPDPDERNQGQ